MKKLKIIYTSDTHGHLFPEAGEGSLLQCIGEFERDSNTLVIDGGDSLQGSPILRFMEEEDTFAELLAPVFNYGSYDYFTLGNHDFDHGYGKLKSFVKAMESTCILANVVDKSQGIPLQPYDIKTMRSGLRVGIAGLVTDFTSIWHSPEQLGWLSITDCFTAAKECNLALKNDCDIKICVYHGGFEEDLETGELLSHSKENIACRICRELDFDILLTAHQHTALEGRYYHGTYVMQLPAKGKVYGEINVELEEPFMSIKSKLQKPGVYVPFTMVDLLESTKKKTDLWLQKELCLLYEPMVNSSDRIKQAMNGSPLVDFLHYVQFSEVEADISCVSLPNNEFILPEVLKVSDVVSAFPHVNSLVVLEVTGEILYQALLRTASYLLWTPQGFVVDPRFLKPKVAHSSYDFFANISFTVLCNPYYDENLVSEVWVGQEPLNLEKTYKVAMSDFRASGAGGYEFYSGCPVVEVAECDMQLLILDFFHEHMPREIPSFFNMTVKT